MLIEDRNGLVIVEKHVAHERVLYDRILRRLAEGESPSQGLLAPHLLEVGEVRAAALASVEGLLRRVGIEAEVFGGDTVRLSSVPRKTNSVTSFSTVLPSGITQSAST